MAIATFGFPWTKALCGGLRVVALGCATVVAAVAQTPGVTNLRMSAAWDSKSDETLAVRQFADLLSQRTKGRLKVDVRPDCALARCDQALAELSKGAIDLDASALWQADANSIPAAAMLGGPIPGLRGSQVHRLWLENDQFRKLIEQAYAEKKVRVLAVWSDADLGLASRDRVQTVEQLLKQTIRSPDSEIAAKVFTSIGLKSSSASNETIAASIPNLVRDDRLRSTKYWQPWFLGPRVNRIAISEMRWKELPAELQLVLKQVAEESARLAQEAGERIQGNLLAEALIEREISFLPVADSEIEKLRRQCEPGLKQYIGSADRKTAASLEQLLEILLRDGTQVIKIQPPSAQDAVIAGPTQVVTGKPSVNLAWRMSVLESPTDNNAIAMRRFAQLVAERTGGGIQINVYPACTLVKCTDTLKELGRGTVAIDENATIVSDEGTLPVSGVIAPPFLGVGGTLAHNLFTENIEYRNLINQLYQSVNVKVLAMWNAGDTGLVSLEPLQSVDDFKGRIVRPSASQISASVLRRINAEPAMMSGSEAVQAMRQKIINVSLIEPSALISRGYSDFAKYWQPWRPLPVIDRIAVNVDTWKSLPAGYQQILQETATQVAVMINRLNDSSQGIFLLKNLVESHMSYLAVPKSELEKIRQIAEQETRKTVASAGQFEKAADQLLDIYLKRLKGR